MPSADTCPICLPDARDYPGWLQCDVCSQWYHSMCLGLSASEISAFSSYHCDRCSKEHGPSELRRRSKRSRVNIDYVALNEGDVFAVDKSEHPHVSKFEQFSVTADTEKDLHIDVLEDLTIDYVVTTRLAKPILVPGADFKRLGMALPVQKEDLTIDYILEKVGDDEPVEVMDVLSQQGVSPGWSMRKWRDYFVSNERDRIRNVISLEISQVDELGKQFRRPEMVEQLDLIDKVWSDKEERPQVTKYCLMSVKGSFTDFHIDFGGTQVYYTVCKGAKTFLMIPPTDHNLDLYTSWCLEPNQNYLWFPEYSKTVKGKPVYPQDGFKVTLRPGDVFIIPSGWIHAVYTPEDSIIIGGNYLTMLSMRKQLQIYNIEKTTKVPMKFRHPRYNKVLWLAAWYYFNHQEEFLHDVKGSVKQEDQNSDESDLILELHEHLRSHYELAKTNPTAKKAIPTATIGKDVEGFLQKLHLWGTTSNR